MHDAILQLVGDTALYRTYNLLVVLVDVDESVRGAALCCNFLIVEGCEGRVYNFKRTQFPHAAVSLCETELRVNICPVAAASSHMLRL